MFTKTNVTQETKGLLDTSQSQGRNTLIRKNQVTSKVQKKGYTVYKGLISHFPKTFIKLFLYFNKSRAKG